MKLVSKYMIHRVLSYKKYIIRVVFPLKEYAEKDYISFQKKGTGETNSLQQIVRKSVEGFRRYGHLHISQWMSMTATIL